MMVSIETGFYKLNPINTFLNVFQMGRHSIVSPWWISIKN
jgi:hypothetical protein